MTISLSLVTLPTISAWTSHAASEVSVYLAFSYRTGKRQALIKRAHTGGNNTFTSPPSAATTTASSPSICVNVELARKAVNQKKRTWTILHGRRTILSVNLGINAEFTRGENPGWALAIVGVRRNIRVNDYDGEGLRRRAFAKAIKLLSRRSEA